MNEALANTYDILELYDILGQNRELITNTWNFFVSVHIAIFGLLYMAGQMKIPYTSRIVVLIAYAGFMYLNYNSQVDNYNYALALIELGLRIEADIPDGGPGILTQTFYKPGWLIKYLQYMYAAAGTIAAAMIMIPVKITQKS